MGSTFTFNEEEMNPLRINKQAINIGGKYFKLKAPNEQKMDIIDMNEEGDHGGQDNDYDNDYNIEMCQVVGSDAQISCEGLFIDIFYHHYYVFTIICLLYKFSTVSDEKLTAPIQTSDETTFVFDISLLPKRIQGLVGNVCWGKGPKEFYWYGVLQL